jgi:hypothetical protein
VSRQEFPGGTSFWIGYDAVPPKEEDAMRIIVALALIAVPSIAAAKPELKCEFEGTKTKVTIVNPDSKRLLCHYNCNFTYENGAGAVAGSIGVAAGETKVVSERTRDAKVVRLNKSELECE